MCKLTFHFSRKETVYVLGITIWIRMKTMLFHCTVCSARKYRLINLFFQIKFHQSQFVGLVHGIFVCLYDFCMVFFFFCNTPRSAQQSFKLFEISLFVISLQAFIALKVFLVCLFVSLLPISKPSIIREFKLQQYILPSLEGDAALLTIPPQRLTWLCPEYLF